jgi:hypothetical protein
MPANESGPLDSLAMRELRSRTPQSGAEAMAPNAQSVTYLIAQTAFKTSIITAQTIQWFFGGY